MSSFKRRRKEPEATFAVNNQGKIEQWTSKRIEKALGLESQQVTCLASIGFDFEVGADGRLVTAKGGNFNDDMYERFKVSCFGNGAMSEK